MKFQIKHRWSSEVIFETEAINLREAVEEAVASGADLRYADLRYADLSRADLSGADLSGADLSGARLNGARLNGADLHFANLRYADLSFAGLSGANLRGANLHFANLRGANLHFANLRYANLRFAKLRIANLDNVPRIKSIHQAVYTAASAEGALDMSDWHTCETTHCWAGWVTTLAGEEGAVLEHVMGTAAAATLIYLASDPQLDRVPDFYATDAKALADMKRLAEQEAAA